MNLLELATLIITGFVSCAEFGSYAFVHPVLRRLPVTERVTVEQGLLKTFGRVMPFGMALCVVLAVTTAVDSGGTGGPLSWSAAAAFTDAVVFTVVVNVPINRATGRWDAGTHLPTGSGRATAGISSRASARGCCCSGSCWCVRPPPSDRDRARPGTVDERGRARSSLRSSRVPVDEPQPGTPQVTAGPAGGASQ